MTLIESVIAMVILAGAFVSLMSAVTSSRAAQVTAAERAIGDVLAEDLMSEVLGQNYQEEGISILGIDGLEILGPGRSQYDDVDDYNGWTASPPQDQDWSVIAGTEGYTRSVTVQWVWPLLVNTTSNNETGVKRVTVTVKRGDRVVSQLVALRSDLR